MLVRGSTSLAAFVLAALFVLAPASAQDLRKSPYWMDVREERATLMLELDAPGTVTARLRSGDAVFEGRDETDGVVHALIFDGLEAGGAYVYEVDLPAGEVLHGTLRTAPPRSTTRARFAVYGDNRSDPEAHRAVAAAVSDFDPEFVLNTGDMVYAGTNIDDWQLFFEQTRTLYDHVPLFPVLGNHELFVEGAGARVYRRFVRTPLAAGRVEPYYAFDWDPVRVLVLDSNQDVSAGTKQRTWLDAELLRASDDQVPHLFAALHHGPLSGGYHGPNALQIAQGLEDALRDGGVELVFEGHDHLYERGDAAGLKYIVTGGGGAPLYRLDRAPDYQLAFLPVHHFVGVEIDGARVTIEARTPDGALLDRCSYERGHPFVCADGTPRGPVRGEQTVLAFYLRVAAPWLVFLTASLLTLLVVRRWRRRRAGPHSKRRP